MNPHFVKYVISLYQDVPKSVYVNLLAVFFLGAVLIVTIKGYRNSWQYVIGLLLGEYVSLIYCSTVIFRKLSETAKHDFTPFWSYVAIYGGRNDILRESIMNVVAFVPVGLLLWFVFRGRKIWQALAVGLGISVTVEVLQYVLKRGFAEFDDVFHNTLGCLIGFVIVAFLKGIWDFCSHLCVLQWGRSRSDISDVRGKICKI